VRKPTPSAPNPDLAARAKALAKTHYCDNYRQHEAHPGTLHMSAWLGGGIEQVTCPGHATGDTKANFETCVKVHQS
jgi:hypothetical protein